MEDVVGEDTGPQGGEAFGDGGSLTTEANLSMYMVRGINLLLSRYKVRTR
jgi:hypothetical protein